MVKLVINTESEEFRRALEEHMIRQILDESDVLRDVIQKAFESDEIQNLLKEKTKAIVMSDKLNQHLTQEIENYIENTYCMSNSTDLDDILKEKVEELAKMPEKVHQAITDRISNYIKDEYNISESSDLIKAIDKRAKEVIISNWNK